MRWRRARRHAGWLHARNDPDTAPALSVPCVSHGAKPGEPCRVTPYLICVGRVAVAIHLAAVAALESESTED